VEKLGFIIQWLHRIELCTSARHCASRHQACQPDGTAQRRLQDRGFRDRARRRQLAHRTGQVVGTITYMSPEQINAQVVDGRTDIFSAGVMLYELLTGVLPFDGKDTASTLLKIIHEPPPPLKNFLDNYRRTSRT